MPYFLNLEAAAMHDLVKEISAIAIRLHPDRVDVLAKEISLLNNVNDLDAVKKIFGHSVPENYVKKFESAWKKSPETTPAEIAYAFRGASTTHAILEGKETVEMVWSGPPTGLVPIRHTEQVLLEVIDSAKEKLSIVSFVAYNIESIIKSLEKAAHRKVQINILLESSKSHGGKVDIDSINVFQKRISSANIYVWKSNSGIGAVHAKCALADSKIAFITSANLTMAAMERNMELGILIRGGELTAKLDHHFDALIATKIIEKI